VRSNDLRTVKQVAAWRLCMGCGACVYSCKENAISLVDVPELGIRPKVDSVKCKECGDCVEICPGIGISHEPFSSQTIPDLRRSWGPVLEVWEGYATDAEIRYNGSSGGAATALALYCVEKERTSGVLHIGAKAEAPLQNVPVLSTSREELLMYTGSRYSPAAPCEKLKWIREAGCSYTFIGKPCDVVALRKSQAVDPKLNSNVGLAISIFCAGTPATEGTYNLLDTLSVKPDQVENIRYRGCGWPGMTTIKVNSDPVRTCQISYQESWGKILSKHIQFRCRICPDSTGEFADISCGDPWYRRPRDDTPGLSLILVRTERGRGILLRAITEGYLDAQQVNVDTLPNSQKALLRRRRNLFGRLFAMRLLCIPTPSYSGFFLLSNWRHLSLFDKVRSILGTVKRIISRKLYSPIRAGKEVRGQGSKCSSGTGVNGL